MNIKPKIALITIDSNVLKNYTQQLKDCFNNLVEVKSLLLRNELDVSDCNLIVCSSIAILDEVKKKTDVNLEIICINKAINPSNLLDLLSLTTEKKALLICNHASVAIEMRMILDKIGLKHLEFMLYKPGMDYEGITTAITPGGVHIIPEGIEKVVDVGINDIDISTIIEIFIKLKLPLGKINYISKVYSNKVINYNKQVFELNQMFEAMFKINHDGVAGFDKFGNIIYCNEVFADILGYNNTNIVDKNITEFFQGLDCENRMLNDQIIDNEIFNIDNNKVMLNKTMVYQEGRIKKYVLSLKKLEEIQNLEVEVRKKLKNVGHIAKYTFKDIVGTSSSLTSTIKIAKKIAKSDMTVLIEGQDGTGKELFAQSIHNASKRRKGPFIAINIAALPESLVESELFGYEEGSFTGASKGGKAGFFEQAHKGTIFIDEIGDASPKIQMRLLRVLQEKEVMRVGSSKIIPIDVRVIAATNKDIHKMIEEGQYRKDLYYRLKVLHINIPTLLERKEDIPYLTKYFLEQINSSKYIDENVIKEFKRYPWPGNIRELENMVCYLDNVSDDQKITIIDLPQNFNGNKKKNYDESSEIIDIHRFLKATDKYITYRRILKIIDKCEKYSIRASRKIIADMLFDEGEKFSDQQLRNMISRLKKFKLIEVGVTKQGTKLTSLGRVYIQNDDY